MYSGNCDQLQHGCECDFLRARTNRISYKGRHATDCQAKAADSSGTNAVRRIHAIVHNLNVPHQQYARLTRQAAGQAER